LTSEWSRRLLILLAALILCLAAQAISSGPAWAAPGDGIVEAGVEECDDGDLDNGDGCSSTMTIEPGYMCTGSPSVCTPIGTAGDGVVDAGEECDDGDLDNGDGCSGAMTIEPGYACTGSPSVCTAEVEVCDANNVDEDSDGLADDADPEGAEGKVPTYEDADADGYGAGPAELRCDPGGRATIAGDTDDTNPNVNPGATEVCDANDVEEDSDGAADDADPEGAVGKIATYLDADGDGYGTGPAEQRCDPGARATQAGDPDDTDPDIYPGSPGKPELGPLSISPQTKKVRRGRSVTITVILENTGKGAGNVEVCASSEKRFLALSACESSTSLSPGELFAAEFEATVRRKARAGAKAQVLFTAAADEAASRTGTAVIKVKRRSKRSR
jgi:cysteine-rich repeat protein